MAYAAPPKFSAMVVLIVFTMAAISELEKCLELCIWNGK